MNIGRAGSDPPGRTRELTMSKSGRDSLHRDHRTGGPSLSCVEMGTIVHHSTRSGHDMASRLIDKCRINPSPSAETGT